MRSKTRSPQAPPFHTKTVGMIPPRITSVRSIALCVVCASLWGLLSGCTPSIAPFSARAYELAVDLKVDALRTVKRAEEPWSQHADRIERLEVQAQKAYEFSAGRPRNEITTEQWSMMIDPDGYLLGGFFTRWKAEGTLSPVFIQEASQLLSAGFDSIISLESGKIGGRNQSAN